MNTAEAFGVKPTCSRCRYFVPADGDDSGGTCVRHPPQLTYFVQPVPQRLGPPQIGIGASAGFPSTGADRWCGEWRAKVALQ